MAKTNGRRALKPGLVVAGVLVAMGVGVGLYLNTDADSGVPSLGGDDPTSRGIEKAAAYLAARSLHADEAWLAYQAAALLGGEFPQWAEQLEVKRSVLGPNREKGFNLDRRIYRMRYLEPPKLDVPPHPGELPAVSLDPSLSSRELRRLKFGMDLAMRCEDLSDRELRQLRHELDQVGTSYLLTHQLWSAATAVAHSCLDPEERRAVVLRLATHVLAELLTDEVTTDLAIERMAMLCYAGACHWIPERTWEMVISEQRDAGDWGVVDVHVHPNTWVPAEHTAALAFYALARHTVDQQDGVTSASYDAGPPIREPEPKPEGR
jgi:hypothetical protein